MIYVLLRRKGNTWPEDEKGYVIFARRPFYRLDTLTRQGALILPIFASLAQLKVEKKYDDLLCSLQYSTREYLYDQFSGSKDEKSHCLSLL